MHICMITPEFLSGGIGSYVYNLSKNLIKKGNKVTVITKGSIRKTKRENIDGIIVFKVTILPLYPFHIYIHGIFVNNLFKSLEDNFDIVHLHSPLVPFIKTNLPLLTTVHTLYINDTKNFDIHNIHSYIERLQSIFLNFLELKVLKKSNKITTLSNLLIKELEQYGFKKKQVYLLGNGVDENTFYPNKNVKYKDKYILYVGRIGFRKGLFTLLNCAEYVLNEYPSIKFLIAGKGPILNKLRKKIRQMGIQKKIVLLGYVNKKTLLQLYRNAYIILIPSNYEGLPNVLLEAMSSGIPVVATNVGGNPEIISSGVNGFLVPPKAPLEMAQIILKILDNNVLRKKIGKKARITIEKNYTWNIIANKVINFYNEIL